MVHKPWSRLGTKRYHHGRGEEKMSFMSVKTNEHSFKVVLMLRRIQLYHSLLSNIKNDGNDGKDFSTKAEGVLYNG